MGNSLFRVTAGVAVAGTVLVALVGVVAAGPSVGAPSVAPTAPPTTAGAVSDGSRVGIGFSPAGPVTTAATGGSRPVPSDPTVGAAVPISGYDKIQIGIELKRNATARWTVEFRYRLDDEPSRTAFDRATENVSGPPVVFRKNLERWAVSDAREATGRSMELYRGNSTTDRTVSGNVGIVRYTFLWTNFAAHRDDHLVVEDTIGAVDFERRTSVAVRWPDTLRRESVSPTPDYSQGNVVRWDSPLGFQAASPRVELVVTDPLERGGLPVVPIAAVGLLLVAGVVGGWYARSRWRGSDGAAAADEDDAETPATPPDELLTDEERVLHLIEANGGRMKQQDLIEAVEWSRTKASDVVNEMHEAERIELYRLGRENVLALPGEIEI